MTGFAGNSQQICRAFNYGLFSFPSHYEIQSAEEITRTFWGTNSNVKSGEVGSGILEIKIIYFTSRTIFSLLFMCRLKDVLSLVIFQLWLQVFHFIKSYLQESVQKLTQVSIEILKISYVTFTFKLNKKKCHEKNRGGRVFRSSKKL